ncbi:MAG: YebC/PmpR family DNA-binding transcriptional regulator [Deltaproteobacteria bacterium]|nr:YebC/PmpR family DNA-binding transcriptional regulator [Deltaproteobacteria bacterium]
MSGHNRWSKIKHKKLASDARKSKGWSKLLKAVTLAASTGVADPAHNPTLRSAVDKAKGEGIPNDTISRAIKKGSGELGAASLEELLYEAYGPGGTAMVIEVLTDNRNRAAAEIRHLLDRHNARLAASGAVTYLFKRRGTVLFEAGTIDEEKLLEAALEVGAEDIQSTAESVTVLTEPAAFLSVKEALETLGFAPAGSELALLPETTIRLEGKEAVAMAKLVNALDDHDDVQNVFINADIDDEVFERLQG